MPYNKAMFRITIFSLIFFAQGALACPFHGPMGEGPYSFMGPEGTGTRVYMPHKARYDFHRGEVKAYKKPTEKLKKLKKLKKSKGLEKTKDSKLTPSF